MKKLGRWWPYPIMVLVILSLFIFYSLWAVIQWEGEYESYLSPLYSPIVFTIWIPIGFRVTCYYYRKAYYRAYFNHPTSCSRGEINKGEYWGETKFPFILNNLHRYFFIGATVILAFLYYDTILAFFFEVGGETRFEVHVGSIVFLINIILLTFYTLSCHSLRHLAGGSGGGSCFTKSGKPNSTFKAWRFLSKLNCNHSIYAWMSLIFVMFTDFYLRLLLWGVIPDVRLF
jgi:hypothetical protein